MTNQSDWSGEVKSLEKPTLNTAQIKRLMRMTGLLRSDASVMDLVALIKKALDEGREFDARGYWCELEDAEQEILWLAPKFGGIFTTRERELIRSGE